MNDCDNFNRNVLVCDQRQESVHWLYSYPENRNYVGTLMCAIAGLFIRGMRSICQDSMTRQNRRQSMLISDDNDMQAYFNEVVYIIQYQLDLSFNPTKLKNCFSVLNDINQKVQLFNQMVLTSNSVIKISTLEF